MLTVMRDKLSGWITWTIIVVISLVFVLFGVGNYFESGSQSSQTLATVGDLNITQNELNNVINNLAGQYPDNDNISLRKMALEALIDSKVKVVSAEQMGADMSTGQLDQAIFQIPAFQENDKFSENRFQYFISKSGLTLSEIRNDIKDNSISNQVAYGVAGSTFVLPEEMDKYVEVMLQKRNIQQAVFLSKNFADKTIVSEKEIESYYHLHRDDYKTSAEVSLNYIELSVDQLAKDIEPTEEQALAYYDTNKTTFYKQEERQYAQITLLNDNQKDEDIAKTANSIIKQSDSGGDFSKLVDKYSDDVLAKKNNGNMGWVKASSNDTDAQQEAINNALFELKDVGDTSSPIITKQGIEIIKLTAVKEASQESFSEVKLEILKRIKMQKAEREYSALGNEMSNLAFENPQSLDFVSKKLNLKIQTLPAFTREGAKEGIASNKQVVDSAFSDGVLKDKNNSDPINISDTESVIVHLNSYVPSSIKPLTEVRVDIETKLKLEKQEELSKQKAQEVASALNDKGINHNKYDFKKIADISRENKSFSSDVIQDYMSAKLSSETNPNFQVVKLQEGYGVFAVTQIFPPADNNKMQNMMYGQLLQQTYGSYIYQLYLTEIKKEIPVEIQD